MMFPAGVTPDVLIAPSQLKLFAKVSYDAQLINQQVNQSVMFLIMFSVLKRKSKVSSA